MAKVKKKVTLTVVSYLVADLDNKTVETATETLIGKRKWNKKLDKEIAALVNDPWKVFMSIAEVAYEEVIATMDLADFYANATIE